ncbi:rhomboid family intramembrane serine protease [bacterium]|nr:rhomboid family intramembrane serine protease [candidate division CSSED10-310 bacterium]
MRIKYNSPVILTFTLVSTGVLILDRITGLRMTETFFIVRPSFSFNNIIDYFRMFSHIAGHADWSHLIGNVSLILLIGPILEEKYGSIAILEMILFTAFITGLLNVLLFNTGLMGASGIVFMLILLSSFTNIRSGDVPLTFILVAVLYLTREFVGIFARDQISQFAHILGGLAGAGFGFVYCRERRSKQN